MVLFISMLEGEALTRGVSSLLLSSMPQFGKVRMGVPIAAKFPTLLLESLLGFTMT